MRTFLEGREDGGRVDVEAAAVGVEEFVFGGWRLRFSGPRSAEAAEGGGFSEEFVLGSGRREEGRTDGGGMRLLGDWRLDCGCFGGWRRGEAIERVDGAVVRKSKPSTDLSAGR